MKDNTVPGLCPVEMTTAVLHDVIEDTPWSIEDLALQGFPEEVLGALEALTHRDGESYDDYIDRIARNKVARTIKLADLEDNLNLGRLTTITEDDALRATKYRKALAWLQSKESVKRRKHDGEEIE